MAYKSFFNWSGGKDSALALYHALNSGMYSVEKLLTNVSSLQGRILMHEVREVLLEQQASAIGIALQKMMLPDQPEMAAYEERLEKTMRQMQHDKFTHGLFGDIFLEDLKLYRETQLTKVNITPVFPLWKRDTTELMHEFIDLGFKTIVVCTRASVLDDSFAGRIVDKNFLKDLPAGVDPCGENGEFHTFVFDGPIFSKPVAFKVGEKIFRGYKSPTAQRDAAMGFWFCDVLPA